MNMSNLNEFFPKSSMTKIGPSMNPHWHGMDAMGSPWPSMSALGLSVSYTESRYGMFKCN